MDPKQQKLCEEMQNIVLEFCDDEYFCSLGFLLRWLLAENFKVIKAVNRFKKMLQWRKDNNIDNVLNEDFQKYWDDVPINIETVDKFGRTVIVLSVDGLKADDLLELKEETLTRFGIYVVERIEQKMRENWIKSNKTVWQNVAVVDSSNLSQQISKISYIKILQLMKWLSSVSIIIYSNYPRGSAVTIVLNASKWFTKIYNMYKFIALKKESLESHQIYQEGQHFNWQATVY